jgi:hypothetical protein
MRLPARAMLTGVSANRRRPWAHLPRSPGITVRLANPRRLIDPSASRTRLHSKRSGWKTKFHQPDFLMALPALRVLWRSLLLRARASVCPYTIIASCITPSPENRRGISVSQWLANPTARLGREIRAIVIGSSECSHRHQYAALIPMRIGARWGQSQQEGESHLPEDRQCSSQPGCCRLGATIPRSVRTSRSLSLSERAPMAPLRPQKLSALK